MKISKLATAVTAALLISSCSQGFVSEQNQKTEVVKTYSNIVLASYEDSLIQAKALEKSITKFLDNPSEANLIQARQAWLKARVPYLQTEAYRFYEGPIDFENHAAKESGPEARINAWPLNEAYIDYVFGNKNAGIVNDPSLPISIEALKGKNQQKDEADVATGYHAIEFLLWGQDLSSKGPGNRKYTDYLPNNKNNDRRRLYLQNVTQLLVQDLQTLVNAWNKDQNNYRKEFTTLPENEALSKILTGIASMIGNEFANERINNALISGDQEDEQSCFSDNTKNDYIYNFQGVKNVYFGKYENTSGRSIKDLVEAANPELNAKIVKEFGYLESMINDIEQPFDSKVLGSDLKSFEREKMKKIVEKLHKLANLLVQAGTNVGATAVIISE